MNCIKCSRMNRRNWSDQGIDCDAKRPVQIVYFWGRLTQVNPNLTSVHISSHFPDGRGLANTRISPFWILLELTMMEVVVTTGAIRRANLQSNHHHQQTNIQLFTGRMSFLSPNQQCQSTECKELG